MNEPSERAAIDATRLTKRYRSTVAVREVEVAADGGVVGLLGPNGSGKTTLLRMLATVLAPDSGTLRLFGLDPSRTDERVRIRRRLGYLPQHAGLYLGFTAYDLVDYVAVLKEMTNSIERRDEVRRVLGLVGLTDAMHQKIRTMSGGTRRRVAIASALIGSPSLLLVDEPGAGLDPDQRLQLRSILADAGRHGTVVVSTHHTDDVVALCRRVLVLVRGEVRFDGSPAQLADAAAGRVWVDDGERATALPGALRTWASATGGTRAVGSPPPGAQLVAPTIDEGYLVLTPGAAAAMMSERMVTERPPGSRAPTTSPSPLRALTGLEARRGVRSPWLWLGVALTGYLLYDLTNLDWRDSPYEVLATAFTPLGLAMFLVGLDAGSRDRRSDVPALAEEAVLGASLRGAARLLALWPLLLIACVAVTVTAIVERTTGGLVLGERLRGVAASHYSIAEVLQVVLLFGLAGAAGVAGGRLRRARVPLAIAGLVVAFLFGTTAWAFQWSPARYVTPLLTQPVSVPIDLGGVGRANVPADWVLDISTTYHGDSRRLLVSQPMVVWHDVYLVGLLAIFVGLGVPTRWSRRMVVLGAIVAIGGVAAQILTAPGAISLAASAP